MTVEKFLHVFTQNGFALQTQWYQHQADIFQHLYPRSNTTGALSDLSGGQRNSDSLSITSGSDASEDGACTFRFHYIRKMQLEVRCRKVLSSINLAKRFSKIVRFFVFKLLAPPPHPVKNERKWLCVVFFQPFTRPLPRPYLQRQAMPDTDEASLATRVTYKFVRLGPRYQNYLLRMAQGSQKTQMGELFVTIMSCLGHIKPFYGVLLDVFWAWHLSKSKERNLMAS